MGNCTSMDEVVELRMGPALEVIVCLEPGHAVDVFQHIPLFSLLSIWAQHACTAAFQHIELVCIVQEVPWHAR